MATLPGIIAKNIIRKVIKGEDYRGEVVAILDAELLQYAVDFFKRVASAKLENEPITLDWYKKELLNPDLPSKDFAIHAGLNEKTIKNMYKTVKREVVLEASLEHYDALYSAINELVTTTDDVSITLTIKLRGVSVDLNVSESLIVINTIAVKRAALRGGLWSTAGKQVEKPLLATLCALYRVPKKFYDQSEVPASLREVDFYLVDPKGKMHRCEVKLMGMGNPESADSVIAHESDVFIADTLSETIRTQLNMNRVMWVELRQKEGFRGFETAVLQKIGIPHKPFKGNLDKALDKLLPTILTDEIQASVTPKVIRESLLASGDELILDFQDDDFAED